MNRFRKLALSALLLGLSGTALSIEKIDNQNFSVDIADYQWNSKSEKLMIVASTNSQPVWQESIQTSYQVRSEIFDLAIGRFISNSSVQVPSTQSLFYISLPSELDYEQISVIAENSDGEQRVLETIAFDTAIAEQSQSIEAVPSTTGFRSQLEMSTVTTILNNGPPENRIDIALLGDGYVENQMDHWQTDAEASLASFLAESPYSDYKQYFNAHRIDLASSESGASHPENNIVKDTAFGAFYNCGDIQRLICADSTKVYAAIDLLLQTNQADIVLLIVNDQEYGGSGGQYSISSTHPSANEIMLHEVGHSYGLLADEYDNPLPTTQSDCSSSTSTSEPNASTLVSREDAKWNHWIDSNTAIPTPYTFDSSIPGLYAGSKYCNELYRPTPNSKMRSLGRPFDAINEEALILRLYDFVSAIEGSWPATNNGSISIDAAQSVIFEVDVLSPENHELQIEWFANGRPVQVGRSLSSNLLQPGAQELTAVVSDRTSKVRVDTSNKLIFEKSWQVNKSVNSSELVRFEDNILYLPSVRIQSDSSLYRVELSLTASEPYLFTLTAAEALDPTSQVSSSASLDNNLLLTIDELTINSVSFSVTLQLTETEPNAVFSLQTVAEN